MCGRFTMTMSPEALEEEFALAAPPGYRRRFNVAPSQEVLVMVEEESGVPRWRWLRWGLVPFWAKDPGIGSRMINARAETVASKPAYRDAIKRRRCLVVADGFFEWQPRPAGKQPIWIHPEDGRPIAFAGLWDRWGRGERELRSCTIVTTEAIEPLRAIHDRMPLLLDHDARERWLDPEADLADLLPLLVPSTPVPLRTTPVSTLVNSPANDTPECIEPAAAEALGA